MLVQPKAGIDAARTAGASRAAHLGWHRLIESHLERSGLDFKHVQPAGFMQSLLINAGEAGVLTYVLRHQPGNCPGAGDSAAVTAAVLRTLGTCAVPKLVHGAELAFCDG